jgi:GTP-binding protein
MIGTRTTNNEQRTTNNEQRTTNNGIVKIISADFVTSAAAGGTDLGIPRDGLPQVAMAGRSNVGKSTLINTLLRRQVARTSAAPGKTRLANVFRITVEGGGPGRWSLYLVDLPGYGYARGGADAAKELAAVAEAYFRDAERLRPERGAERKSAEGQPPSESEREPSARNGGGAPAHREMWGPASSDKSRRLVFLLVDSRHPGLDSDLQAYRWLTTLGVDPLIVATKIDKLSRAERTRNLRELERVFGTPALPVSAERGEGLEQLWTTIAKVGRAADRRVRAADEGTTT